MRKIERDANSDRVVLISGASSGIGKSAAEYLAQKGYRVFAGLRRPGSATFENNIDAIQLDVTDDVSVANAVQTVLDRAGRVDALVNNAGISLRGPIEETTIAQAKALFDTNVLGTIRLSKMVLPAMRRQGFGRIVNISSLAGVLPAPYLGIYSATKHAIEGFSETLDHEVRSFGIRVLIIQASYVRTNLETSAARGGSPILEYEVQRKRVIDHIHSQIQKSPGPEVVAPVIEQAINSEIFRRFPVGNGAALSIRMRRFLPASLIDRLVRQGFGLDA